MQVVTYSDLLTFTLVIIAVIDLVIECLRNKKK